MIPNAPQSEYELKPISAFKTRTWTDGVLDDDPHPPSRHCLCEACWPSFYDTPYGAAHSEGGSLAATDSQESPATEREDAAPPFRVGDRCMVDDCMPRYVMAINSNGKPLAHARQSDARYIDWNGEIFDYTYRHPTDAELSKFWPDEWIPCTSEAQRLALGDRLIDTKTAIREYLRQPIDGPIAYCWGKSITHYRIARKS